MENSAAVAVANDDGDVMAAGACPLHGDSISLDNEILFLWQFLLQQCQEILTSFGDQYHHI